MMTAAAVAPPACCRCGSADSAIWYPLRRFGLTICGSCYVQAIRSGIGTDAGQREPAPV